jgi:hypothetical protein
LCFIIKYYQSYANTSLPLGPGIFHPSSFASLSHLLATILTCFNASSCVSPCAMHPFNSGISATKALSSLLQNIIISYLLIYNITYSGSLRSPHVYPLKVLAPCHPLLPVWFLLALPTRDIYLVQLQNDG